MSKFDDALTMELPETVQADIVIVGAGACGITIARKLSLVSGLKVLLIESGSMAFDARTQSLYHGENLGMEYFDLMVCRLRFFGGTTNHWGGFCTPTTPRDFVSAPGVPMTDWPISYDEVAPYMRTAQQDLGFSPEACDAEKRLPKEGYRYLSPAQSEGLKTTLYSILEEPKIRFAQRYQAELKAAPNLQVLCNTNVTKIQLDSTGTTVKGLRCKLLSGKEFSVTAGQYVVACHGIENARLLLASNDVLPQGIANKSDHVGRYFMEHPCVRSGVLTVTDRKAFPPYLVTTEAWPKGFSACMTLPESLTNKNKCLQYYCRLRPYLYAEEIEVRSAMLRLREKIDQPFEKSMLDDLGIVLDNFSDSRDALAEKAGLIPGGRTFILDQRIEQAPNADSRVVLAEEKDELGSPRADLNWQLNETDLATFNLGQSQMIKFFGANNIGRVEAPEITLELLEGEVEGHYHHIGTTRMSEDSSRGVVDKNCQVHGLSNLYVVGSSVFCRSLFAGPTMTMLGFAHRLAERLEKNIASSQRGSRS